MLEVSNTEMKSHQNRMRFLETACNCRHTITFKLFSFFTIIAHKVKLQEVLLIYVSKSEQ